MNIFWKKYKNFLILAVLLAFFGGAFFLGISYLMKEINVNNESIKKEIIDHEERQKRLAEIPELRNQFETVERENGKFEITLSQNQMIVLIEKLEEIARGTGNQMTIEDMEIKNEEDEKKAKKKSSGKSGEDKKKLSVDLVGSYVSMKIKLHGSYNNALNFIEKVENMNYCADIISLQLLTENRDAINRTSGALLSVNPFIERGSVPKSKASKAEAEEYTGEVFIDSVLDIVVCFSE